MAFVLALIIPALLLSTAPLALSAPTTPASSCGVCDYKFDADFDHLAAAPFDLGPKPAVPTPYMDLAFQGLSVVTANLDADLLLHTAPNGAGHGPLGDLGNDPVVLNSQFPGSKVRSFDLQRFWFGCKSTGAMLGLPGAAVACSVAVTGYKQDPNRPEVCQVVGPVQIGFNPAHEGATLGILHSPMAEAPFGSEWRGLTNVTMAISTSGLPANDLLHATALFVDNVQYVTHETCCE